MPHTLRLLFLSGSARDGSLNKRLARLGADIAHRTGSAATFADLGDYPLPLYDGDLETRDGVPDNALKLKSLMDAHQGIFIASPEYNASFSPLLKNTLDWISRIKDDAGVAGQVYRTRVFALGSASPGAFGGLRGLLQIRQVLEIGLGALVLPDQVIIPNAGKAFDANGQLSDKATADRLEAVVQRLTTAAHLMRSDAS